MRRPSYPLTGYGTLRINLNIGRGPAMKKCLVIDDSSVIRKVASAILTDMNYSVSEARDAEEGLELCQTHQPDVIILDWHMPRSDSLEFLAKLRNTVTGRRPHVIYCTTEKDPDAISKATDAGADSFMLKPFDRAALVNTFANLNLAG